MRGALPAALALLAGCSGGDHRAAERVVRAYNQAAISAYRARDLSGLEQTATRAESTRVVVLVDMKKAEQKVLESELLRLEMTSVARAGEHRLVATTAERWRYYDRPLRPGAPPGTISVVDLTLSYELLEESGAWRVDRVRALSSTDLEPKGDPRLRQGAGEPDAGR